MEYLSLGHEANERLYDSRAPYLLAYLFEPSGSFCCQPFRQNEFCSFIQAICLVVFWHLHRYFLPAYKFPVAQTLFRAALLSLFYEHAAVGSCRILYAAIRQAGAYG